MVCQTHRQSRRQQLPNIITGSFAGQTGSIMEEKLCSFLRYVPVCAYKCAACALAMIQTAMQTVRAHKYHASILHPILRAFPEPIITASAVIRGMPNPQAKPSPTASRYHHRQLCWTNWGYHGRKIMQFLAVCPGMCI